MGGVCGGGTCMVGGVRGRGACMAGGMHGRGGGMRGREGTCVAGGRATVHERAVRILLECILVSFNQIDKLYDQLAN